ncbi:MAG: type II toxin-antitoxin system prevent-host-death family antitoxin [Ignavibacteriales bacterium]|nr:type II toxin-antitoxin system prevent-host-death family antitoxin [Ignavibacteriales bacterium]
MSSVYTYTQARENLATILDTVSKNNEVVIINRRNAENVAIISESELNSLLETAHLLRSPRNAERLMETIGDALADKILFNPLRILKS